MYGDAATKENDWAFDYLPKVDRNYSWTQIWDNMYRGKIKGMFAFGMNGVAIGPDSQKNIEALKKADWLVVGEIYPDETSEFWRSPGITKDEMEKIQTTVYRLPCAGFAEKDGSMTNSSRWLQWKNVALPPPGQARLDQDIIAQIFLKVRELYKKEGGKFPDPILNLTWTYTDPQHPSLTEIAKEINGKALADLDGPEHQAADQGRPAAPRLRLAQGRRHHRLRQLALLRLLDRGRQPDGAPGDGGPVGPRHLSELGLVVAGQPPRALQPRLLRSGRQAVGPRAAAGLVERGGAEVGRQRRARLQGGLPAEGPHGAVHHERRRASDGSSRRSAFFADGPFPEHYEPIESPVENPFHPEQSNNPVVKKFSTPTGQVRRDRRRVQHRLHHLPADRALPLLDQEQSDERAAHPRAVRRDPGRAGGRRWGSRAATR